MSRSTTIWTFIVLAAVLACCYACSLQKRSPAPVQTHQTHQPHQDGEQDSPPYHPPPPLPPPPPLEQDGAAAVQQYQPYYYYQPYSVPYYPPPPPAPPEQDGAQGWSAPQDQDGAQDRSAPQDQDGALETDNGAAGWDVAREMADARDVPGIGPDGGVVGGYTLREIGNDVSVAEASSPGLDGRNELGAMDVGDFDVQDGAGPAPEDAVPFESVLNENAT